MHAIQWAIKRITVITFKNPSIAFIVSDIITSSSLYNSFLSLRTLSNLKNLKNLIILISLSNYGVLYRVLWLEDVDELTVESYSAA